MELSQVLRTHLIILLLTSCIAHGQTLLWQFEYPHTADHIQSVDIHALTETHDGGYLLAGKLQYPNALSNYYIRLLRTDEAGQVTWDTLLNYVPQHILLWQEARAISELPDGSIIVAGNDNIQFSNRHMFLLKLTAELDTVWSRTYRTEDQSKCTTMLTLEDGYMLIGGESLGQKKGIRIVRTNLEGDSLWAKTMLWTEDYYTIALDAIRDGEDIYISGHVDTSLFVLHINTTGDSLNLFKHHFGDESWGTTLSKQEDELILGGATRDRENKYEPFILRTDLEGNIMWFTAIPGRHGHVSDLAVAPNRSILVTGSGNFDFHSFSPYSGFVAGLTETGQIRWQSNFPDSVSLHGSKILLPENGEMLIAGSKGKRPWLALYQDVISDVNDPGRLKDFRIYPNPTSDIVTIESGQAAIGGELHILSTTGKRIRRERVHSVVQSIDLNELPVGAYIFQLKSTSAQYYAKIVLLHR